MALNAFIERLPAGTSAQIIEIDWPSRPRAFRTRCRPRRKP
jgi:hypothetical protein